MTCIEDEMSMCIEEQSIKVRKGIWFFFEKGKNGVNTGSADMGVEHSSIHIC